MESNNATANTSTPSNSTSKFDEVRMKISNVKEVMVDNIDKMLNRGEKLELLDTRTTELSDSATRFSSQSRQLRRNFWVEAMKKKGIIIGLFVGVLLFIIFLIIVFRSSDTSSNSTSSSNTSNINP